MLHHMLRAARKGFTPVVYLVTASGTGSYTAPVGSTKVTVEAIGGGGNGFFDASSARGGGGGGYAKSIDLPVTGGSTVVYYSVGGIATSSWVRVGTNSAPTASTQGCLGYLGSSAASGTSGTGGATTNSIGDTKYSGASGGGLGNRYGGGAGGDGGNASGVTGGGSGDMKGGNGGAYNAGTGADGTAPGGAGSGSTSGSNRPGSVGRVRITFS